MAGISKSFTPSVNIERDSEKEFDYVVTSNSRRIYEELVKKIDTGTHSFTIIGSYGTGKSSFLVALRKNLIGDTYYFEPLNGQLPEIEEFKFDFIVGRYGSLINEVSDHFGLSNRKDEKEILDWIDRRHEQLKKEGKFWFIVIDEFGKHLEYAAKENPERELYFVQLLAEYVNEEDKNIFFVTTLHQAFDSYAHGLDTQQRKEWDKVRGRLKELTFNEPVEQLLHIASEYLRTNEEKDWEDLQLSTLIRVLESTQAFPLKNELDFELGKDLYPIDPLAAATLSLALQKYGQNERSLFTFLQSEEYLGINNYDQESNPYYNIACVYDYLIHNHHSFLSSKHNPHFVQWNALKKALERVEGELSDKYQEDILSLKKVVKTIGLLNIFASEGAQINREFIIEYGKIALGIEKPGTLLEELEKKKIIRYRSYKGQFILFEGTDLDIEHELQKATSQVDRIKDIVTHLKRYFDFPFLPAKRVYYECGTPRFFEFKLSEEPISSEPQQPVDGFINLVFKKGIKEVKCFSDEVDYPILYGIFNNTAEIENQLFLIKRTKHVIKNIEDDKIAERELKDLLEVQIEELNDMILDNVYAGKGDIEWIFNGESIEIIDSKSLNNQLSIICEKVYHKAPTFHNELINKEKVSPAIYRPRKTLLKGLINDSDKEDLGFEQDTFPAEKTIYLSLLKHTGIHRKENGEWLLGAPQDDSGLKELWGISQKFFDSTKSGKRNLTQFISVLKKPPLGLKDGLIELWVPIFLIIKENDYALFQEESYIPELTYEVVNLVFRNPKLFEIKAYHISDLKKKLFASYRKSQNKEGETEFTNQSFVETIRPFLLVYNSLNEYGRNTSKISEEAQRLRDAIKTATEPEKAFFEEFPRALGYTNIEELNDGENIKQFSHELDQAIEEIKGAYNKLLDRIEECLKLSLDLDPKADFERYKNEIQDRYKNLKSYKLVPYQKKLLERMLSTLSDRDKWLNSVAFAILDKPLSKIDDEEEPILLDRLSTRIEELDNLRELNKLDVNPSTQEAYKFKLQPFSEEALDLNIIIDKNKLDAESERYKKLKQLLTNDKQTNLALLVKLIKDLEDNE